jgi:hypothetical protein
MNSRRSSTRSKSCLPMIKPCHSEPRPSYGKKAAAKRDAAAAKRAAKRAEADFAKREFPQLLARLALQVGCG